MVLKKTKRGVWYNTGNTIRAFKTSFNRRNQRQGCFLRQSRGSDGKVMTLIDDIDSLEDNVPYSINKKGRWNLQEVIEGSLKEEQLEAEMYEDNYDVDVRVMESYNLTRSNHTYCIVDYIQGNYVKTEGLRRLVNGASIVSERSKKYQIDVQIEFLYPHKGDSLLHKNNFTGLDEVALVGLESMCPPSKKNRRKENKDFCRNTKVLFNLESVLTREKRLRRKYLKTKQVNKKKKFQKNKMEPMLTVSKGNSIKSDEFGKERMESVLVQLPNAELEPATLQREFGKNYAECPCIPRKFVINITDQLEDHFRHSDWWKGLKVSEWNMISCVTFSYAKPKNLEVTEYQPYHVCLNMLTTSKVIRILTLYDQFKGSLTDVLKKVVHFIDMSSATEFIKHSEEPPRVPNDLNFKLLNLFLKVDLNCYYSTDKLIFSTIFEQNNYRMKTNDLISNVPLTTTPDKNCLICLDRMNHKKSTTMLVECRHVFCDKCWLKYLKCRLKMGYVKVLCPRDDCSTVVEDSTILLFLDVVDVMRWKRLCHDLSEYSTGSTKWCPHPRCSRMITITNSDDATSITCHCGKKICFKCLHDAHWPLSCEYAQTYWKNLKENGDDKRSITNLDQMFKGTKKCPNCNILIEKNGHGIYMSCICGTSFCWGCQSPYPNHNFKYQCLKTDILQMKDSKALTVKKTTNRRSMVKIETSTFYKMAIGHRLARHDRKSIRMLRTGVRKILSMFKSIPKKRCSLYANMISKFEETETKSRLTSKQIVEDKIAGVLWELVNVYVDFHHIAEHSFILLEYLMKHGVQKHVLHVPSHINQLSLFAENVSFLIKTSDDLSDYRLLIESLMMLEKQCQNEINNFVKVIYKLK